MARINMEKVKFEISAAGFEYENGEYKNLDSMLVVKCKEGHKVMFSLKQIRTGKCQCPVCLEYDDIEEKEKEILTPTKKKERRVLALDQATEKTGYAIFEGDELINYGIKHITNKDIGLRIAELRQWMVSMTKQWKIDEIGLENIYYSGNPQTLIALGRLLGALESTCLDVLKKPAIIVAPATWRSHCEIKGKKRAAQKENAQTYIKNKYGISVSQDAADAICLGNCVVHQTRFEGLLKWE